ncbi:hypothetical protein C8F01DRAFT_1293083 [Mycena amicta]|nr:hypothetical protein C8F01DRAFT_1293083 [Mycena amicta]
MSQPPAVALKDLAKCRQCTLCPRFWASLPLNIFTKCEICNHNAADWGASLRPSVPTPGATALSHPKFMPDTMPVCSSPLIYAHPHFFGQKPTKPGGNPLKNSTASSDAFKRFAEERKPFNPAERSQKQADLDNPGAKKRKHKSGSSCTCNVKPKKLRTFTAILMPRTDNVSSRVQAFPSVDELVSMDEAGLIKHNVEIPEDAEETQIFEVVLEAFGAFLVLREHGWRPLRVRSSFRRSKKGKKVRKLGSSRRLVPIMKPLSMATLDLCTADSSVRKGGRAFKRPLFISLVAGSPNLAFGSDDVSDNKVERDLDSSDISISNTDGSNSDSSDDDSVKSSYLHSPFLIHPQAPPTSRPSHPQMNTTAGGPTNSTVTSDGEPSTRFTWSQKGKAKEAGTRFHSGYFDDDFVDDDFVDDDFVAAELPTHTASQSTSGAVPAHVPAPAPDHTPAPVSAPFPSPAPAPAAASASASAPWEGHASPQNVLPRAHPASAPPSSTLAVTEALQIHLKFLRLLKNMHAPTNLTTNPLTWYASAEAPVGPFGIGLQSSATAASVCDLFVKSSAHNVISTDQAPGFIRRSIIDPFAVIQEVSDTMQDPHSESLGSTEFELHFNESFAIGPGGVHALAAHMTAVYAALPALRESGVAADDVNSLWAALYGLSKALLRCLEHLRFRHRREYDPTGGFREFAVVLRGGEGRLPVASPESFDALKIPLLLTSLLRCHVGEVRVLLMETFGDMAFANHMRVDAIVCGGPFGIRRIFDMIAVLLLDTMDTSNANYNAMFTLINRFFLGASRVLRHHLRGARPPPPPSNRSTCSQTQTKPKPKHQTFQGDEDDLGPNWPFNLGPQPPRTHKRKPSPIDVFLTHWAASDDDTDPEWRRTFDAWKEQNDRRKRADAKARAKAKATRPQPQPKAKMQTVTKPRWINGTTTVKTDLEDAENAPRRHLHWDTMPSPAIINIACLLAYVVSMLKNWPHRLQIYHFDRNINEDAHFKAVVAIVTRILNDTYKYKRNAPE